MIIYKISNCINGKVYIGQHAGDDVQTRWEKHCYDAFHGSELYFHHAIRKNGPNAFRSEVLYTVKTDDPVELARMETFFIVLHQSFKSENGYNLTMGGEGTFGYHWT